MIMIDKIVTNGTAIINVGAASRSTPWCSNAGTAAMIFTIAYSAAIVPKSVDKTIDVPTTVGTVDIAAGAANPTAFMAKAKAGKTWANELFASALNPSFSAKYRAIISPIIFSVQTAFKKNAAIANGKRYSTTLQSLGTKTNPTINMALIDIAIAKGIANMDA